MCAQERRLTINKSLKDCAHSRTDMLVYAQERGLTIDKSFKGVFTMGGRTDGMDCAVSNRDINGKVPHCPRSVLCSSHVECSARLL